MLMAAAALEGKRLLNADQNLGAFLKAAFSTIAVPYIVGAVANKTAVAGFNSVEAAWRNCARIGSVKNFQAHTRVRLTDSNEYTKLGPDEHIQHGELDEMTFTITAYTFAKMLGITRTDLINDDLGAFAEVPKKLGLGAAKKLNTDFWTMVLGNASSFFAAGNSNYISGATTALGVDSLTQAEYTFLNQTQPDGHPVGIVPKVLLVPNALLAKASQLMASLQLNETTTADTPKPSDNPHAGKFSVVRSSYLSMAALTGYSTTAWYLLADPSELACWEVAFLNGKQEPTVETSDVDFDQLGIQMRGYIDYGLAQMDYRAGVMSRGAA
jgi:hypothetical protein